MCFEHGMVQKHNFFEESVRVPLLFRLPGVVPAGAVRESPVELLDLFPTFCDLAGAQRPDGLEGRSLGSAINDVSTGADERPVFSEFYTWGMPERMVRLGAWKYMHAEGDLRQLYNLAEDPHETRNRVNDPACEPQVRRLRDLVLNGWEQPDMRQIPHGKPWNDLTPADATERMETWNRTRRRLS